MRDFALRVLQGRGHGRLAGYESITPTHHRIVVAAGNDSHGGDPGDDNGATDDVRIRALGHWPSHSAAQVELARCLLHAPGQ
jgi:hypothetical protein